MHILQPQENPFDTLLRLYKDHGFGAILQALATLAECISEDKRVCEDCREVYGEIAEQLETLAEEIDE